MRSFPPVPPLSEAPDDLLSGGHLWIQELVDAGPLRFRLREDGRILAGDDGRRFGGEVPPAYAAAVGHVRRRLDRGALRSAVEDPTAVVFFGGSTHFRGTPYDFRRTPPFLGFDVWDGARGRFLPPDAVEGVYERLGLEPVNALRKELRAVDFDPGRYEFPASAWYDGPVAGVVLRDKTGHRALLSNPAAVRESPDPVADDPAGAARELVTDDRIRRATEALEAAGEPATVPAVVDRTVDLLVREEWARIAAGDREPDRGALRAAVAERVRRSLEG